MNLFFSLLHIVLLLSLRGESSNLSDKLRICQSSDKLRISQNMNCTDQGAYQFQTIQCQWLVFVPNLWFPPGPVLASFSETTDSDRDPTCSLQGI